VLYASQVQVQANQAGDKLSATVEAIAPGIDLAVLKLDDETFFRFAPPAAAREDPAGDAGAGRRADTEHLVDRRQACPGA
jgi:hypothetical protein